MAQDQLPSTSTADNPGRPRATFSESYKKTYTNISSINIGRAIIICEPNSLSVQRKKECSAND